MVDEYTSPFRKKPFERKHLVENPRDIFSVSLNPKEREMINYFRHLWQCDNDGTVLKGLAKVGANVLQTYFGKEMLQWLASPKRVRGTAPMPKNEPNVTPKSEVE